MAKLTQRDKVDIINAYAVELIPMIELAEKYNISRAGIWKMLKKNGVDTGESKMIQVSCTTCGTVLLRNRARIRNQKNHFCNYECYYAFLEAGNGNPYIQNRHGQRIGRRVVSEYFDLQDGHIVHHEDRNTLNNLPHNLKVFATQGDHIRYHRGFEVQPLWDGDQLNLIH